MHLGFQITFPCLLSHSRFKVPEVPHRKWGGLRSCRLWGRTESDTTEAAAAAAAGAQPRNPGIQDPEVRSNTHLTGAVNVQ